MKLYKHIFTDVIKLYKNFLHWNFSKVSIAIFGFLIALTIMIPFLLITFIILFVFNVDWYAYTGHFINNSLTYDMVLHKDFFIWALLWIINAWIFFLSLSYSKIMYFDLNIKYLNQKHSKYNKMKFFHFPIIWNYYKMSFMIVMILLIPIIIGIILFSILVYSVWWVNQAWVLFTNWSNYLSLFSQIIMLMVVLSFIYLSYRLYFSYIIFIKNHDSEELSFSAKKCIEKSWKITNWWKNILRLLAVLFILIIALLPISIIEKGINNTYNDMRNYELFLQLSESDKLQLQNSNPYYYGELWVKYSNIWIIDLQKNIQIYYYIILLFNIATFIFIAWLIEMFMVSFYKRVLTHK